MEIPIKKTHSSFLLLLVLFNILRRTSMEMISEEYCDVDDAAMSQWYSQVFQFVKTNCNLEVKLEQLNEKMEQLRLQSTGDDLNEKLHYLEVKVEKTFQKLDELNAKLKQQVLMDESLEHLNVKVAELKLKFNGDDLKEKLHSLDVKMEHLSDNMAELKLNGDDLKEKLHSLEVKVEQSLQHLNEKMEQLQQNANGDIVIQRRMDGSVDFFRPWADYKLGFGNSSGEFFIGLEKLHKLTNSRPYELLVVMEDWANDRRYAKYDQFIIGSEAEKYALTQLGTYSGSAGDSLKHELGQKFTTKDQDNDMDGGNCAVQYTGAWWYKACHSSNLNGRYLRGTTTEYAKGVVWKPFKGYYYSLKFVEMIIRPN